MAPSPDFSLHLPLSETSQHARHCKLLANSAVDLHWLKSPTSQRNTFVSNRVAEIQRLTINCEWKFVSTQSGVDFYAPIDIRMSIKRGSKQIRTYIAIFVCFATKAIHVELSGNLTTGALNGCSLKRHRDAREVWAPLRERQVAAPHLESAELCTDVSGNDFSFDSKLGELGGKDEVGRKRSGRKKKKSRRGFQVGEGTVLVVVMGDARQGKPTRRLIVRPAERIGVFFLGEGGRALGFDGRREGRWRRERPRLPRKLGSQQLAAPERRLVFISVSADEPSNYWVAEESSRNSSITLPNKEKNFIQLLIKNKIIVLLRTPGIEPAAPRPYVGHDVEVMAPVPKFPVSPRSVRYSGVTDSRAGRLQVGEQETPGDRGRQPVSCEDTWTIPRRRSFVRGRRSQCTAPVRESYAQRITTINCLDYSFPTEANRVRIPARWPPDFCMWESCRTMLLGVFSRGSPVSPSLEFRRLATITSQDLAVKSRPKFLQSLTDILRRLENVTNMLECNVFGKYYGRSANMAAFTSSELTRIALQIIGALLISRYFSKTTFPSLFNNPQAAPCEIHIYDFISDPHQVNAGLIILMRTTHPRCSSALVGCRIGKGEKGALKFDGAVIYVKMCPSRDMKKEKQRTGLRVAEKKKAYLEADGGL
ncbi:hypothetical protein PR048_014337 [Dryococelus australis]|uniref:Uncharacterized protein n=1 Tax=Dryococelus australis TaxID=614101 RepID=A0ABQ9HDW8_9NEOP|nr:hypothetical protein PR048_014337 [Dryococelus australis]